MSKNHSKKVHITTFGCQMNEYDSARMLEALTNLGYEATEQQEQADLLLFNTCSVRHKAESKLYSFLGRFKDLKKQRPQARIVVAGCVAQQEGEKLLKALPQVDLVLGPDAITQLASLVPLVEQGRRLAKVELNGQTEMGLVGLNTSLKAQVTVMRGCNNFCSYCIVPYVRGRETSRAADDIVNEVKRLVSRGAKEVRLLGQNVNSYADTQGTDFAALLKKVAQVPDLWRIRFTTSHPKDLSPALIEAMASLPQVMPEIHLPAQSGSNRILQAMNRKYTREHYLELVKRLRENMPNISMGGDFIVGFPGESEQDFQQSLDLLEQVQYDFLFSFKYSDRPPAPASRLEGKLDEEEKNRRLLILQEKQRHISQNKNQALVGKVVQVLVEGQARKGGNMLSGRAPDGRAINFAAPPGSDLQGRLVQVKLKVANINSLRGEMLAD